MIFKGIPESSNEVTWEDTKKVLAETVSKCLNVVAPVSIFERAHRSHFAGRNNEKQGRRDIFVKLFDWNNCERFKEDFRKLRARDKNCRISCEQKYGPITSARRNYALLQRKGLKESGAIFAGFVKYPALMTKKTSNKSEKYIEHEDYSKFEVDANFNVVPPE